MHLYKSRNPKITDLIKLMNAVSIIYHKNLDQYVFLGENMFTIYINCHSRKGKIVSIA